MKAKLTNRPAEHDALATKLAYLENLDPKRDAGLNLGLVEKMRAFLRGEVPDAPKMPNGKQVKARAVSASDLRSKIRSWKAALPYEPDKTERPKPQRRKGGDQSPPPEADPLVEYRDRRITALMDGGAERGKMLREQAMVEQLESDFLSDVPRRATR